MGNGLCTGGMLSLGLMMKETSGTGFHVNNDEKLMCRMLLPQKRLLTLFFSTALYKVASESFQTGRVSLSYLNPHSLRNSLLGNAHSNTAAFPRLIGTVEVHFSRSPSNTACDSFRILSMMSKRLPYSLASISFWRIRRSYKGLGQVSTMRVGRPPCCFFGQKLRRPEGDMRRDAVLLLL